MLPFPFFAFPGAGGNWQTIDTRWWSPTVSVNFAGNPSVEREVTEDVASYGRQIGWLNEIVLALAKGEPDVVKHDANAADSLAKLKDAQQRIAVIKKRRADDAYDTARSALAKLGKTDKPAYGRLVRSLDPDVPPTAP